MLEFSYNTKKIDKQTFMPYQIIYGETSVVTIKERMMNLHKRERLQEKTEKVAQEFSASKYKENDWIYVQRRGERKDKSSISLDHRWWRSFRIKKATSPQNYELDLSFQMKIHPVFNIYNLKLYHGSISDSISKESLSHIIKDIEEWKIEDILDKRQKEYLMRWKEYPEATWKNKANLKNVLRIVQKWEKSKGHLNNNQHS